jgi:hypothetical protein
MNWTQGFFRLWLAISTLWMGLCGIYAYSAARDAYDAAAALAVFERGSIALVPVICQQARGELGRDYARRAAPDRPWEEHRCWYEMPNYRRLFPEYQQLTDADISKGLYAAIGQPLREMASWQSVVVSWVPALVIPPAMLLLLGVGVAWIIAGFRRRSS